MEKRKSRKVNYTVCSTPDKPLVYVLRGENGDMLIDTGTDTTAPHIEKWIEESGFDIKWIFLTHGHFDHAYNAGYFRKKYGAKLMLHEKDLELFRGLTIQSVNLSPGYNADVSELYNTIVSSHNPVCDVDVLITDDDADYLRKIGFDAEIVMFPGHTDGSMGIKQGRVVYCGDACAAKGGDYYTSLFGSDIDLLLDSEKKIFSLDPLVIAPGHGKLIINERAFPTKNEKGRG